MLKDLVQQYIALINDEMEDSTEWAYVALDPALVENEEVTTNYLKQISEDEFKVLGEDRYFEDIVSKFKSSEILSVIRLQYKNFFGESTDTDFYRNSIEGLDNCIK